MFPPSDLDHHHHHQTNLRHLRHATPPTSWVDCRFLAWRRSGGCHPFFSPAFGVVFVRRRRGRSGLSVRLSESEGGREGGGPLSLHSSFPPFLPLPLSICHCQLKGSFVAASPLFHAPPGNWPRGGGNFAKGSFFKRPRPFSPLLPLQEGRKRCS